MFKEPETSPIVLQIKSKTIFSTSFRLLGAFKLLHMLQTEYMEEPKS